MPNTFDSLLAAAFALHSRPGAYAVLVGSGVSTAAGIPTGWQIVEDLIGRIAAVDGIGQIDDPEAWYQQRFGEPPTYAGLVGRIGLTAAERQALIGGYIQPEPEQGLRVPTPAHRALARLVGGGWVRIVLTTNFDPLIEQALHDAGVPVTVLASPDAVAGRLPLAHAGPTLVKLHGDHRDPRIKNTDVELDEYEPPVNELLDEVLANYGLIVCGWSAQHDTALRRAVERCPARRFTTFWAARGTPSDEAQVLIRQRDAEVISIADADDFLGRVADAVQSLAEINRPHPLSVAAAVATVKRDLAGQRPAISVHDAIRGEITRLRALPVYTTPRHGGSREDYVAAVDNLLSELELPVSLVATTAHWGHAGTDTWWLDDIDRLALRPLVSGTVSWIDLVRIPALALFWAGGVAAIAGNRHPLVCRLLRRSSVLGGDQPGPALILTPRLIDTGEGVKRLYRLLRAAFVDHLGLGLDPFLDAWERWQYLLLLNSWDARKNDAASVSLFRPHMRVDSGRNDTVPVPESWLLAQLPQPADGTLVHDLLAGGLFNGDTNRLRAAVEEFGEAHTREVSRRDDALLPPGGGALPTGRHYPGTFHTDPDRD